MKTLLGPENVPNTGRACPGSYIGCHDFLTGSSSFCCAPRLQRNRRNGNMPAGLLIVCTEFFLRIYFCCHPHQNNHFFFLHSVWVPSVHRKNSDRLFHISHFSSPHPSAPCFSTKFIVSLNPLFFSLIHETASLPLHLMSNRGNRNIFWSITGSLNYL